MNIRPLSIPEVLLVQNSVFKDDRGFFAETFRLNEARDFGLTEFVQENHSRSAQHVIRGLHFQIEPYASAKLVRCVKGEIFDVAVDVRPNSITYKQWVGVYLNDDSGKALYIPKGFAHGFCVISNSGADVVYKVSEYYQPKYEKTVRWNDPDLKIEWPMNLEKAIISERDAQAPLLKNL